MEMIDWKSYVFEFNNRQLMCDIYNIHAQKFSKLFIQTAWSWKMAMSHVSVVLPCGATVGCDLCCWVCACVLGVTSFFFHRYGKRNQ